MELERDSFLTLSSINQKRSFGTHKIISSKKIIEKPGHIHMRQTKFHIHSLGRREHIIYLHDSLIVPLKSGLRKLVNNMIQQEAWLLMISTCSSPRHLLIQHAISFEFTSKMCINCFNQFSVYFKFKQRTKHFIH